MIRFISFITFFFILTPLFGKGEVFHVEVSKTEKSRKKGLMHRKVLGDNNGMLFLYPKTQTLCFWMKNTYVPLDILLLDNDNRVIEVIKDMVPHSETRRCFKQKGKRALEIKARFYRIRTGDPLKMIILN